MKHWRRRVEDDQHASTLGNNSSKTFDRKTFFECSNRMKRLVPTLNRQQPNLIPDLCVSASQVDREWPIPSKEDDELDDDLLPERERNRNAESSPLQSTAKPRKSEDDILTCEDFHVQQTSSGSLMLNKERHLKMEMNAAVMGAVAIATLPRNIENNGNLTLNSGGGPSSSATLPPNIHLRKQKQTSGRRIWLKPLTHFVSFMSNIGDNIHITSYPTP